MTLTFILYCIGAFYAILIVPLLCLAVYGGLNSLLQRQQNNDKSSSSSDTYDHSTTSNHINKRFNDTSNVKARVQRVKVQGNGETVSRTHTAAAATHTRMQPHMPLHSTAASLSSTIIDAAINDEVLLRIASAPSTAPSSRAATPESARTGAYSSAFAQVQRAEILSSSPPRAAANASLSAADTEEDDDVHESLGHGPMRRSPRNNSNDATDFPLSPSSFSSFSSAVADSDSDYDSDEQLDALEAYFVTPGSLQLLTQAALQQQRKDEQLMQREANGNASAAAAAQSPLSSQSASLTSPAAPLSPATAVITVLPSAPPTPLISGPASSSTASLRPISSRQPFSRLFGPSTAADSNDLPRAAMPLPPLKPASLTPQQNGHGNKDTGLSAALKAAQTRRTVPVAAIAR